jgi:hypothetical protein
MNETLTNEEIQIKTYTPYQGHLLVNKLLSDEGIDKKIKPQMIYNYVRKGTIASVEIEGKKRVTKQSIIDWTRKYIAKQNNTSSIFDD